MGFWTAEVTEVRQFLRKVCLVIEKGNFLRTHTNPVCFSKISPRAIINTATLGTSCLGIWVGWVQKSFDLSCRKWARPWDLAVENESYYSRSARQFHYLGLSHAKLMWNPPTGVSLGANPWLFLTIPFSLAHTIAKSIAMCEFNGTCISSDILYLRIRRIAVGFKGHLFAWTRCRIWCWLWSTGIKN